MTNKHEDWTPEIRRKMIEAESRQNAKIAEEASKPLLNLRAIEDARDAYDEEIDKIIEDDLNCP